MASKETKAWTGDMDPADWISSKANKKRPERKASTAQETKRRFKKTTIKVKTSGKKKHVTVKK